MDRRTFFAAAGAAALIGFDRPAFAQQGQVFTMWHSPGCGCCLEWGRRVRAAFGRTLNVVEAPDMAAVKRANGVPQDLWSCHTARIGNVTVEGHVPPADIRRLIGTGNRRGLGLAVPGMPAGSPGMDVGHNSREPFTVFAFDRRGGRSAFARYNGR